MNLYYAFGGGLGHLNRAKALIHSVGLSIADFIVLSNSTYASLVFDKAQIIHVSEEYYQKPNELQKLIQSIISDFKISEFYIDSFPCGIIGELNGLDCISCSLHYIARILNWDNYLPLIELSNLYFDKTFVIEPLLLDHTEFINKRSKIIVDIDLTYHKGLISENTWEIIHSYKKPPWLIVHSEPFDELQILYYHALEIAELEGESPEFLVISQVKEKLNDDNVRQINYFPAADFFPFCEKIFTACGFNSMYQTIPFANKHHFIPFIRRYDNQFIRARNRKPKLL